MDSHKDQEIGAPPLNPNDDDHDQEELEWIRHEAQRRFAALRQHVASLTEPPEPWLPNGHSLRPEEKETSDPCSRVPKSWFFHATGFWLEPGLCRPEKCHDMKSYMQALVEQHWHPRFAKKEKHNDDHINSNNDDDDDNNNHQQQHDPLESFGTTKEQNEARGDYFLDSAARIHFFAEPSAIDSEHRLLPQFSSHHHKILALNKVGHGLHLLSSSSLSSSLSSKKKNPFVEWTHSPQLCDLVRHGLQSWQDPVVPQSMYIFKHGRLDSTSRSSCSSCNSNAVHAHQDSTFLCTTPYQSCLGVWLALDDATLTNGCLWVRPYSHREPLRRQYQRNAKYFEEITKNGHNDNGNDKDKDNTTKEPKLVMKHLTTTTTIMDDDEPNHGPHEEEEEAALPHPDTTPRQLLDLGWLPVECRAGDVLLFCGTLDHLSLANHSPHPRHSFQLHLVEGPRAGVTWSPLNWLQYNDYHQHQQRRHNHNHPKDNHNHNDPTEFVRLLPADPDTTTERKDTTTGSPTTTKADETIAPPS
ncbi:hypothetical protein ACA910_006433 [Epithemia clementina (nom. ined.)]